MDCSVWRYFPFPFFSQMGIANCLAQDWVITDGGGNPCFSYLCCICQFLKKCRLCRNLWCFFQTHFCLVAVYHENKWIMIQLHQNYEDTIPTVLPQNKILRMRFRFFSVYFYLRIDFLTMLSNVSPCCFFLLFIFKHSFSWLFLFPFSLFISCLYLFLVHWTIVQALE